MLKYTKPEYLCPLLPLLPDNLVVHTDDRGVCTIKLNRPDIRNAFDSDVIEDVSIQLTFASDDDFVRIIVITGEGSSFSSGADINWIKSSVKRDHATNSMEALKMALDIQGGEDLQPTICQ